MTWRRPSASRTSDDEERKEEEAEKREVAISGNKNTGLVYRLCGFMGRSFGARDELWELD